MYVINDYKALDAEGMDMEIDLSNLGTVNTMFAALFRFYSFLALDFVILQFKG